MNDAYFALSTLHDFGVEVKEGPDDEKYLTESIFEIEDYFKTWRYFFTRFLLLAIEREQLVDLVEALMLEAAFRPSQGPPSVGEQSVIGKAPIFVPPRRNNTQTTGDLISEEIAQELAKVLSGKYFQQIRTVISEVSKMVVDELQSDTVVQALFDAAKTKLEEENLWDHLDETQRQALKNILQEALEIVQNSELVVTPTIHLSEFIDPEPFAITGNTLMFRLKHIHEDDEIQDNELVKEFLQTVVQYPGQIDQFTQNWPDGSPEQQVYGDDIYLPTSGVFAEAILGRSNASEKIDITRFYNWQDSPIPHLAPKILPVQVTVRAQQPLDGEPTVPGSVLNIVNPAAFPDPVGLAASLAAVQNGQMFRDMSGQATLGTVLTNLSNLANQMAGLSGKLAGDAAAQTLKSATDLGAKVMDMTSNLSNPAQGDVSRLGGILNQLEGLKSQLGQGSQTTTDTNAGERQDEILKEILRVLTGMTSNGHNGATEDDPDNHNEGIGDDGDYDQENPPSDSTPDVTEDLEELESGFMQGRILFANFDVKKAELTDKHRSALDQLYEVLSSSSEAYIEKIEGRASQTGPEANNEIFSRERANAIKKYMVEKGFDAQNIGVIIGHGSRDPLKNQPGIESGVNRSAEVSYYMWVDVPEKIKVKPTPHEGGATHWAIQIALVRSDLGTDPGISGANAIGRIKNTDNGEWRGGKFAGQGLALGIGLPGVFADRKWIHFETDAPYSFQDFHQTEMHLSGITGGFLVGYTDISISFPKLGVKNLIIEGLNAGSAGLHAAKVRGWWEVAGF